MMLNLLPKDFKKNWMLYSSAVLTWSLVTYISLAYSTVNVEFLLRAAALLSFIVLFSANISALNNEQNSYKVKTCIVIQVLLVWFLIYFDRNNVAPILLVIIATQLANLFSKQQTLFVLIIINIGYYLLMGSYNQGVMGVFIFFLLQIFAYSAMDIMIRAEQDREKISEINQELLATRFMLKEASERKERLRISRDLHDVIGHQLTALSLNLEVSCHKVANEFKPMLEENLRQAKTLLSDVRQVVKEMRHEEQFDLITVLEDLIEQLPNCQLNVVSSAEIKSLALKQQLMFCLQEGITNALKHGKANQLVLSMQHFENRLTIDLTDNGVKTIIKAHGSGILGMKERLSVFNGQVELIVNDNGCTLQITLEDCYD